MQDTFERKQKFKEYVDEHLIQDKDELEEIIKERAGKVTEEVINERFVKYYRERKSKEEAVLEEYTKRSSSEAL